MREGLISYYTRKNICEKTLVNLVYLSARGRYRIEREDRAGKGYADFIFYPTRVGDTVIILELKMDASPESAIHQIEEKRYTLRLTNDTGTDINIGKIHVVGITYDRRTKMHHYAVKELL